jgi:hypothetical protein
MGKRSMQSRQKSSVASPLDIRLRLAAGQATSAASRRRITRNIGAAAGGLLGLAFLPLAVANADDYDDINASGKETVTGLYGHGFSGGDTAPPAVPGSIQGEQLFNYTDTTTSDSGTFYGLESTSNDGFGDINTEVYVAPTPDTGIYSGAGGTGEPPVGSVFDTYTFDDGVYTNVYSDVDGTVTDTLESPLYGNVVIPTTFDAANGSIADAGGVPDGIDGDLIDPVGSQHINAISGIPPLTVALQGTQTFDVNNASGTGIGSFNAVDTTTTDGYGTYTEAVLATSPSTDGSIGAGSIFNTMDLFGTDSIYSDVVPASGTGADTITETISTSLGSFTIPDTFDAAKVETISDSPITLPSGMTFDPTTELNFTGINGLPPVDVGVQGGQDFNFADGGNTGSFTADVTNSLDEFNDSTETILVTSTSDAAALPQGSEFEIVNLGNGFESVYTDIVSATAGQDTITETLVTPLGDISLTPSFDAAAGLVNDLFSIIAGGGAL